MIWLKSVGFGFLLYFGVIVLAVLTTTLTTAPELSNVEFYVQVLMMSLMMWYAAAAAGALLLMHIKQIKVGLRAFLTRSVLLWGPISFGWYMMVKTGVMPWFLISMFISSVLLCYEVLVFQTRVQQKG